MMGSFLIGAVIVVVALLIVRAWRRPASTPIVEALPATPEIPFEQLFGTPSVIEPDQMLAREFGESMIDSRILCRVTGSRCEQPQSCMALGCRQNSDRAERGTAP